VPIYLDHEQANTSSGIFEKIAYDIPSALLISSPNTSLYARDRTIKKILFTFLFATSVNAFNVQANAAFGKRSIISDTALKMSGGSVTATPDLKVGLFILLTNLYIV
jgi:hypothetical protein